jgi:cytochrome c biogenesis protein CcmG, thiol:disulfide interchange protein DsbE
MSEPTPEPSSRPEKQRRSPISVVLRAVTLIFVGGLLGLLVYRLIASERGGAVVAAIKAGRKPKAPHFDLKVIWQRSDTWSLRYSSLATADRLSTDELKGMPVVMNFWASWCIPCKHEAPRLVAAASKYKTRALFLGVDVQDFTSDARNFLRRYKINYPSVRDGTSSTFDRYGLTGVPETYYLDAQGRLVGHTIGEVSGDELEREILKLERRS